MEVKPGYKQTDVGIIPEEWDVSLLQEVVDRKSPIAYGVLKPGDYFPNGVPLLQIRDVIYGDINTDSLHRIGDQLDAQYLRTKLVGGEIVVSLVGTIGKVAMIPATLSGGNLHRNLARISIADKYDSRFVYHYLCSDAAQAAIKLTTFGSTQALLNLSDLRSLPLPIPTMREQQAIAVALGDMDALLGVLDRLIAKKCDIKQAAMQQLLTGQTRLYGFAGAWGLRAVGEIAVVSKGTQLHSSETTSDGEIPHYNGGIFPSSYTDKANTPANTVAISEGGNSCGYVQMIEQKFWCGGHCYAITPKTINNNFLYHALKGRQPAIMGLRVGSGLPNVQKAALTAFKLAIPEDPAEQTAIAAALSDMDVELAALEAQREKTRDIKVAMMQELLTGKTRLV